MNDKKLRWGILSTANIGRVAVTPAIQASGNGELVAVASRDEAAAREYAEEAGIPRAYGSYDALLADEEIDAVYIPLPNSLHREWSIRASEAGKHVLCEKPMALDASQCMEMRAAARENGVKLMEAFMYRFHPRTERVLEKVHEGAIGELRQIRSSFTFPLDRSDDIRWDRDLGGGALMDLGCYCVNVSRTMTGREPVEVRALANWNERGVDGQMAGSLLFADGLLAHFDCALTMDRTEVYHLMGSEGHMRVLDAFRPGSGEVTIENFDLENHLTKETVDGDDQYRLMVEHFAHSVLNGLPFRYGPGEAALNMKVVNALYESAIKDGAEVKVE